MSDLVVVQQAAPVQLYSARNMNFDALEKRLDDEEAAFSRFPGDGLNHNGKKGDWLWGYGKKGVKFDHTAHSFVFNLPSAVEGWRKWADGRVVYGPMIYLCSGERLPDRNTLGDTDESMWELVSGKPKDPWERYVACPIRIDGTEQVNHIFVKSFWGRVNFMELMRTYAKEGRKHMGKLPVVNLGNETRAVKDSKTETFEVGTFDLVDWEMPIAADFPEMAEQEAAQAPIPEATATITKRAAPVTTQLDIEDAVKKVEAAQAASDKRIADSMPESEELTRPKTEKAPDPLYIGGGQGRRRSSKLATV